MCSNQTNPNFQAAISVAQMRRSDLYTITHLVPSKELMYRAALGVYRNVDWENKTVAILCGSGNNAGDGYALATILQDHGILATILLLSDKFSTDGAYYYQKAKQRDIPILRYTPDISLSSYDILVDCLLGTGFCQPPREPYASAIAQVNEANRYVVSVDINSGLHGDTGEGTSIIHSNLTVSIGFYKKGLFLGKAPQYIDRMVNVDIGIVLVP